MTEQLKQAAQQALEALKHGATQLNGIGIPLEADPLHSAIAALERALTTSQPAQAGEVDDGDVTGQPGPLPETGWDEVPEGAFRKPSPTAGMNLGERIKHVGGRENAAGYIEFGSVAAVRALVRQYLRDLPAPQQATPEPAPDQNTIKNATPEPVGEPDLAEIMETVREIGRLNNDIGRSRGPNNFAMNSRAVQSCVDLEMALEKRLRALLTRPAPGVPEVDPLQGAVDWFWQAIPNLKAHDVANRLSIGCNRAAAMLAAAQAKGADPEDLAAAGVMLMGRRTDHA